MEHEIMQDIRVEELNDDPHLYGESFEDLLALAMSSSDSHDDTVAFAIIYSQPLHLGFHAASLASGIAEAADIMLLHRSSTAESIVGASVYIASHILNQPGSQLSAAQP